MDRSKMSKSVGDITLIEDAHESDFLGSTDEFIGKKKAKKSWKNMFSTKKSKSSKKAPKVAVVIEAEAKAKSVSDLDLSVNTTNTELATNMKQTSNNLKTREKVVVDEEAKAKSVSNLELSGKTVKHTSKKLKTREKVNESKRKSFSNGVSQEAVTEGKKNKSEKAKGSKKADKQTKRNAVSVNNIPQEMGREKQSKVKGNKSVWGRMVKSFQPKVKMRNDPKRGAAAQDPAAKRNTWPALDLDEDLTASNDQFDIPEELPAQKRSSTKLARETANQNVRNKESTNQLKVNTELTNQLGVDQKLTKSLSVDGNLANQISGNRKLSNQISVDGNLTNQISGNRKLSFQETAIMMEKLLNESLEDISVAKETNENVVSIAPESDTDKERDDQFVSHNKPKLLIDEAIDLPVEEIPLENAAYIDFVPIINLEHDDSPTNKTKTIELEISSDTKSDGSPKNDTTVKQYLGVSVMTRKNKFRAAETWKRLSAPAMAAKAKMRHSHSFDFDDLPLTIELIKQPMASTYISLNTWLKTCSAEWKENFLRCDALRIILKTLLEASSGRSKFNEAILQLNIFQCIKSILNSRVGLEYLIDYDQSCLHELLNCKCLFWLFIDLMVGSCFSSKCILLIRFFFNVL